jgi:putative ABC transport system permease protein
MHFYESFTGDSSEFITALVMRARARPEDLVVPVQRALQETVAGLPFANVTPIADLVAPSIRPWRLGSTMFGAFALLALILTAVGLYGVLAYTVTQRTHEVGVRMALGAARADVLQLIVGQGLRAALVGLTIGLLGAVAGSRVLSSMLYGVSPQDPLVLGVSAAVLLLVALLASYVPARRATRVDPMVALRTE